MLNVPCYLNENTLCSLVGWEESEIPNISQGNKPKPLENTTIYQTSVKPSIKALPCSAAAKCHFKAASVSWGTPSWPSSSISANASPNTTNPQELGVYGLHTAKSNLSTVATCVNKHLETSCSMPPSNHQNKEANSPNPGTFCAWAFPFSAAKVYHFWASPCN